MSAPLIFKNFKKIKQQGIKIEEIKSNMIPIESYSAPGSTIEWFQNYLILDGISTGIHIFQLDLNGNVSMAIVIKANNNWISFINFGYTRPATQYNCLNGVWSSKEL